MVCCCPSSSLQINLTRNSWELEYVLDTIVLYNPSGSILDSMSVSFSPSSYQKVIEEYTYNVHLNDDEEENLPHDFYYKSFTLHIRDIFSKKAFLYNSFNINEQGRIFYLEEIEQTRIDQDFIKETRVKHYVDVNEFVNANSQLMTQLLEKYYQ